MLQVLAILYLQVPLMHHRSKYEGTCLHGQGRWLRQLKVTTTDDWFYADLFHDSVHGRQLASTDLGFQYHHRAIQTTVFAPVRSFIRICLIDLGRYPNQEAWIHCFTLSVFHFECSPQKHFASLSQLADQFAVCFSRRAFASNLSSSKWSYRFRCAL